MEMRELIEKLCSVPGPSGFEEPVRETIRALAEPFCDEVRTDAMGNLFAIRRCGLPGAKTMLLDAHMDEIGLIVTGQEKGFLRFSSLGGIDRRMLPAREVLVLTEEPIRGVIDTMPPHVLTAEEQEKAVDADKLFIDVGLSEAAAGERVKPGTPVVFAADCFPLGEGQICGKAQDDRACCAILLKILESLAGETLDYDLCLMFSTQEEVGTRGAIPGAFFAEPAWAIAIDVTHGKTPDAKASETMKNGAGPAVAVGPNMNRAFTESIFETAKTLGMDCQTEVIPGNSGTNGWPIQISREGVVTAVVSLPLKYMHTPIETTTVSDAEDIAKLLTAFLRSWKGEC